MTRPSKPAGGNQRLGFRASHADNKRAIQLSLAQHAAMSGMPTPAEQLAISTAKPKQTRAKPGADGRRLEADVQREIIKFLLQHPFVVFVERLNSGAVYGESGNFIRFHHLMTPKCYQQFGPFRVVDLNVMMHDGRRLAIEVKREGWSKPSDQREREQANYLSLIRSRGGIGIFATSAYEVQVALTAAGY